MRLAYILVVSICDVIICFNVLFLSFSCLLILDQDLNSSSAPTSCLGWNNTNDRDTIS